MSETSKRYTYFFGGFIGPAIAKGLFWLGILAMLVGLFFSDWLPQMFDALGEGDFFYFFKMLVVCALAPLLWRTLIDLMLSFYQQTTYTKRMLEHLEMQEDHD